MDEDEITVAEDTDGEWRVAVDLDEDEAVLYIVTDAISIAWTLNGAEVLDEVIAGLQLAKKKLATALAEGVENDDTNGSDN